MKGIPNNLNYMLLTGPKFVMFDIARSLYASGNLEKIITSYPMSKLLAENLPRNKIESHPFYQISAFTFEKFKLKSPSIHQYISIKNLKLLDNKCSQRVGNSNLISMSSIGLKTARIVKKRGNTFILNRFSYHILVQKRILEEQSSIWGWQETLPSQFSIDRELEEYQLADKIIVPSLASYESFKNQGTDMKKVFVNPFPIITSQIFANNLSKKNLLFVGNVSLQKGFPSLIQAFNLLNLPGVKLHVAGIYSKAFIHYLKQRSLSFDNVIFHGPISTEKLNDLYNKCDVLVLPSFQDGWGMVVNEAMAHGCIPVVASGAGASDQIENGVNGFVFESGNVSQLAHFILKAMGNLEIREGIRNLINNSPNFKRNWNDFSRIYLD
jgi:glycosyltransferase involved in cell wall biosynthesis